MPREVSKPMFGYCNKCEDVWKITDSSKLPSWRAHIESSHEKPLDLLCQTCNRIFPRLRELKAHKCYQLSGVEEPVDYEFLKENDPLVKHLKGLPLSTIHEICVSL